MTLKTKMVEIIRPYPYIFWGFIGAIVFIPCLGASHLFDWDEINFAESAREMIVSGDYLTVQINFQPFWEKPPLFIWLQALSFLTFQTFTDHPIYSMEFAARFPNALIGILTLWVVFNIGQKHFSTMMGHLWAFSYLTAITPHVYASSGIIDPLFNLLIFLGIYFFATFYQQLDQIKYALFSGVMIGLAMLTKGPVALLLWGLTLFVFGIVHASKVLKEWRRLFSGAVWAVILACLFFVSWYGLIATKFGFGIIEDFFSYQIRLLTTGDAGHGQPFYYHTVVLILGCFPISIWVIQRLFQRKNQSIFESWMQILFWVVLILFSLVKTKIVHYSSMCWLPLTFFSAQILTQWVKGTWKWTSWHTAGLLGIGCLLGAVLTLVPVIGENTATFIPLIQDKFVQGNLQAPVEWRGWEKGIGLFFIGFLILLMSKKGQVFPNRIFLVMVGTCITILMYVIHVVPKIEGYTQATPIDFYRSKKGQNIDIETVGFKSFAHLLYFEKSAPSPDGAALMNQLTLKRPAFFVMKSDVEDQFKFHPNLIFIKEENGFLFYRHQ